jgi:hypothetical protein
VSIAQRELAALFEYAHGRLLARLDGLTDDEHLWEPVDGCWSVRLADDGTWRPDLGPGGNQFTEQDPPPFTTVAWRLWHLGADPQPSWPPHGAGDAATYAQRYFAGPVSSPVGAATAAEAIRLVDANWAPVPGEVLGFAEDDLFAPLGPIAGPYADATLFGLLLHVADELVHHGAEVGVLRDLYRARPR